jgi:hypothetical protein
MELLSYPKTDYLLEGSLESFHGESMAWLNELAFWSDELAFYYKLLHKNKSKEAFPSRELAEIEKELVKLSSEKIDKVKLVVASHERSLSSVMKSTSLSEEHSYRDAHLKLLGDMHNLHLDIRTFKKNIFAFVQKYES